MEAKFMDISFIKNKIKDLINEKKEQNSLYNIRLKESKKFKLDKDIVAINNNLNEGKWEEYLDICPNINIEQAKIIDSLIPISETVINIFYSRQELDNYYIIFVFTNYKVLLLGNNKYTEKQYMDFNSFENIIKGLMTQIICLDGVLISLDTDKNNLDVFYNLINNSEYRNNYIKEKTKYLCGIKPIYQRLNKINSGISIDSNNIIVFHDKKINNYAYKYDNILNYELLEDGISVLKKKTLDQNQSMKSVKQNCVNMTLRVTLSNKQVFEISILEPTAFNSSYSHSSTIYIENFKFAKEIIDKLDSLNKELDMYK